MSWEQMRSDTRPCPCGKGTITYCMDMDDWNRFRHYQIIDCAKCQSEADEKQRLESERERRRESLLAKAVHIAERRYLVRWLAMYEGKDKKAAWLIRHRVSGAWNLLQAREVRRRRRAVFAAQIFT
jgi:hypothetical protein